MSDQVKLYAIALFFLLFPISQLVEANEYVVGGQNGWTYGVSSWGQVGNFRENDILVFNYPPGQHNVAIVDQIGYENCTPRLMSPTIYTSGNDHVELWISNINYFISTIGDDCQKGIKLAILVIEPNA